MDNVHSLQSLQGGAFETATTESQTLSKDINIHCNKCVFIATCEEELNWHMYDVHDLQFDSYFETEVSCDDCGRWCKSEVDLKRHHQEHEPYLQSSKIEKEDFSCI